MEDYVDFNEIRRSIDREREKVLDRIHEIEGLNRRRVSSRCPPSSYWHYEKSWREICPICFLSLILQQIIILTTLFILQP